MSIYISPSTPEELIERTFAIISQYRDRESYWGEQYYDITLLLNCMMALVVLPREHKVNSTKDKAIPSSLKKTLLSSVDEVGSAIKIGFKEYIIGLRNGIVHWGQKDSLKFESREGKISAICIIGKSDSHRKKGEPDKFHKHTFRFGLQDSNDLDNAVREIRAFAYN
jgi:hypothetical protein